MNNFPQFHEFRAVSLQDKDAYESFYAGLDPYSDYTFNNLLVWFNAGDQLAAARYNEALILRLGDSFHKDEAAYTVLSKTDATEALHSLFEWQRANNLKVEAVMVPEIVVNNTPGIMENFMCVEDVDNFDYIYDVAQTQLADGKQYQKYRHALSYFKNHYTEDVKLVELDMADIHNRLLVINTLHVWDNTYNQTDQAQLEGAALNRLLRYGTALTFHCTALLVDNEIQAFSIFQIPPQGNFAVVNHLKVNNTYTYLFDVTFSKIIERLHDMGIMYVNLEQDLGLPGLRTHKQRLRPISLLRRYTITPK